VSPRVSIDGPWILNKGMAPVGSFGPSFHRALSAIWKSQLSATGRQWHATRWLTWPDLHFGEWMGGARLQADQSGGRCFPPRPWLVETLTMWVQTANCGGYFVGGSSVFLVWCGISGRGWETVSKLAAGILSSWEAEIWRTALGGQPR
jgi:hypothetical protein